MSAHDKLAAYKQVHVNTASPGRKIVMLYDAALKHLAEALTGFDLDPAEGAEIVHNGVQGASQILLELQLALDHERGGDVAGRLDDLYRFWLNGLSNANMAKDPAMIDDIRRMIAEVRDGWNEALRTGFDWGQPQK